MSRVKSALRPFQRFFATEAAGGVVLLGCTALAMGLANSPWADSYLHFLEATPVALGDGPLSLTLHQWVNDALMAVFFLLVGLEIKRELLRGELASTRRAALPVAAAIGGMIVPAAIYVALNRDGPSARGWAIPVATDIAFALGVLALLGPRVPSAVRVFLAALAIVDDIGAVLVIALFYTAGLSGTMLAAAAGILVALFTLNRAGVNSLVPYLLLGLSLWAVVLASGIHATVAGVLLAMTVPASGTKEAETPLVRLEQQLHAPVAFGIMPLFALANAGVSINADTLRSLEWSIVWGIALALAIGKPLGITMASLLARRVRVGDLPADITGRALIGVGWLGGIGFTMSLFVGTLAFSSANKLDSAKIGIVSGSLVSGIVGWLILRNAWPRPRK